MSVFTLKQITEYYNQWSSPVYVCYLDASKAFDRINHWCMFRKLIKRDADLFVIRFLVHGTVIKPFVFDGVVPLPPSLQLLMVYAKVG